MSNHKDWLPYPEEIRESPLGVVEVQVQTPDDWHVVMGASGKSQREVHLETMQSRGIPLYKRRGGGGTVLLGPGVIVVTVHAGVVHHFRNQAYFKAINQSLISVFRSWRDLDYGQRGLSDIAVGDRKIVGSSIFRRRGYLLFQASILVALHPEMMAATLKHPPREPDYRAGRDHLAFVTCLRDLGIDRPMDLMAEDLRKGLTPVLRAKLAEVDEAAD